MAEKGQAWPSRNGILVQAVSWRVLELPVHAALRVNTVICREALRQPVLPLLKIVERDFGTYILHHLFCYLVEDFLVIRHYFWIVSAIDRCQLIDQHLSSK